MLHRFLSKAVTAAIVHGIESSMRSLGDGLSNVLLLPT